MKMADIRLVKIGDIVTTNASSYSSKDHWEYVNYLDTGNITQNVIDSIQRIDLTQEKLPSRAKRKVKGNSIVYSTVRPNQLHYGIIRNQPENFLVSTGFTVIDVDERQAVAEYVYYFLTQKEIVESLQAIGEQSVSTYPSIKPSDIEDIEIPLPSLDIQNKIVGILKSLDAKIKTNSDINNNLLEQIRAICKTMVIDRSDVELSHISEHCIVVTKGTTPTTLGKPFVNQGINFIKAESILDDHSFDRSKFAYIDDETNLMLRRSIIQRDDIVYTIAGTLGRFALVDEQVLPANTNQAVAIIRVDKKKLSSEYLYSLFIADWQNEYYSKHIQQAVQANLSLTTIKSLPIPMLKGDAMKDYVSLITPIISKMKEIEHENALLSSTRDSLLPKLMSGELDVAHI